MTKATPTALTGWRGPLKSISQPNPSGFKGNENIQKKNMPESQKCNGSFDTRQHPAVIHLALRSWQALQELSPPIQV